MPPGHHIDVEVLKSRIQGHLQDDAISLHSLRSFSNHVTYRLDSPTQGELLLRVAWVSVWSDGNRQFKEVSDFKMRSEVATMQYVKEHTSIPVPNVLFYDPDWDRKVGGEWMLMRYIDGVDPSRLWRSLTDDQWEALCTSVADIWSQLLRLRFKFIGSIYEQQDESENRYFIGPMTYIPHSGSLASPEASTSGPFSSAREWLVAVAKGKLNPKSKDSTRFSLRAGTQIVLAHMDYSLYNILVDRNDPTHVIAVVDWEGACTVPMWAANPTFRWPYLLPDSKIPGWEFATGDSCNDHRLLERRAECSSIDPSVYDTGRPILHQMSWLDARSLVFSAGINIIGYCLIQCDTTQCSSYSNISVYLLDTDSNSMAQTKRYNISRVEGDNWLEDLYSPHSIGCHQRIKERNWQTKTDWAKDVMDSR
ncbi:kinase-like domain-containing protein [Armillaria nabsnona]|nr:kinase-like domain-containing protein [Armillaria nabsnona]